MAAKAELSRLHLTVRSYAAGKRFLKHRRNGKLPIVFHLGDHDPSGLGMKKHRIAELMIMRDWTDAKAGVPLPWVTATGDLTDMRHEVKRLILEAGLRRS